jgi:glycosyltransferase involved in cell wall biosynthesis
MTKEEVLIIGPSVLGGKGGIGSVISVYQEMFPSALFYASYFSFSSGFLRLMYCIYKFICFPFFLLMHPNIRLVHIHGASRGSFYRKYLYFRILKFFTNKKVIYHIHGAEYHIFVENASNWTQLKIKQFLYGVDLVVVLSESWRLYFEGRYPNLPIKVISNPVVFNNVDSEPQPIMSAVDGDVRFLFLGRLSDRKGLDILLSACHILSDSGCRFKVNIGGDGDLSRYSDMVSKFAIQEVVTFCGWLNDTEKRLMLRSSDVFLLPSRNEGLPVSIIEAMAYSLPVIASSVGGIPEMIQNGHSGYILKDNTPEKLAECMLNLIQSPSLREWMGKNGKEVFERKYDAGVVKKDLAIMYKGLIS